MFSPFGCGNWAVGGVYVVPTHNNDGHVPHGGVGAFVNGPVVTCSVRTTLRDKLFSRMVISASSRRVTRVTYKCKTGIPFVHDTRASGSCTNATSMVLRILRVCGRQNERFSAIYYVCSATPFIAPRELQRTCKGVGSRVSSIFAYITCSCPVRHDLRVMSKEVNVICPRCVGTHSRSLRPVCRSTNRFCFSHVGSFMRDQAF